MADLISVEEAQRRAIAPVRMLGAERVGLGAALGRVLAEDVVATVDVPPHPNSAMDGWAVRSVDAVAGARLIIAGEIAAGRVAARPLAAGEAYRIMTGAPIPEGADAVLMQEYATREGAYVRVGRAAMLGDHVRDRGEDVRVGALVLRLGATIGAAEVGALASLRRAEIAVTRRPQVAVLATGDELRAIDQPLAPGSITDSNSHALAALVREAGGVPVLLPLVRDDKAAIAAAIAAGREADLIVSTGGVSVGEHDHVKAVLTELGAALTAWRVDMKPGKPVALAILESIPFYGLPGNPVSAMVAFHLFVRPAIRAALGAAPPLDLQRARARLTSPLALRGERRQFLRARLDFCDGNLTATPMARQGSGMMTSMLGANGLIVIAPGEHALDTGAAVEALVIGRLGHE